MLTQPRSRLGAVVDEIAVYVERRPQPAQAVLQKLVSLRAEVSCGLNPVVG
jgi:hypothetical protein